jgi:hypothetical protein
MFKSLTVFLLILCGRCFGQEAFKLYFEVYNENTLMQHDSVQVIKPNSGILANFTLHYDFIDTLDIVHVKGGDSLWIYTFYPQNIYEYSSFHNSKFDAPWLSIPDFPYNIEQYYTTGGYVIRDKFSDSLNFNDTLLYNLHGYYFKVQFDNLENKISELNNFEFNIYPNPSSGEFNLKINDLQGIDEIKYNLFDINGRKILEKKEFGEEKTKINLSHLNQGVYFLEVGILDKKRMQRIVIQQVI